MSLRSTVKPREGNNVGTGTPRSAGPALPSRVLVTGALGGIGLPTVRLLRDLGAHVVAVDLPTRAEATSRHPDDLSGVTYVECDITDERRVAAMIAAWTDDDLPEAVCSLAGAVISAPMVEQSSSDMRTVFDLNFHAQVGLAQLMTRRWLDAGVAGNFIFVSSWVQDVPWPGIGPYAASKAALRSIARTFALEHAPDGIRDNLVAPGIVATGMAKKQWDTELDYRRRAQRAIPLGRLQTPELVAQTIAFLCSDWAGYMTGSTVLSDGGASLYPVDPSDDQAGTGAEGDA